MSQYYTMLTTVGLAKLQNAAATGTKVDITTVAVGDGNGNPVTPSQDMTALIHQVWSGPVTRYEVDTNNPTQLVIEGYIPADVGGWTIRELGIFDGDGDLIAVGNYDATPKPAISSGLVRDLLLRTVIELGNYAGAVEIRIDPAVVLASRQWVDDELLDHNNDKDAHPKSAPVGMIVAIPYESVPDGFLECNGAEISRSAYGDLFAAIGETYGAGDGSTTFNLPDLRGEFIRGWDHGRGVDANRGIGTWQDFAIENITGSFRASWPGDHAVLGDLRGVFYEISRGEKGDVPEYAHQEYTTNQAGFDASRVVKTADETRSRNVALMYCIKY